MTESERRVGIRDSVLKSSQYSYEYKGEAKPPAYERLMKNLSDREVISEIAAGRGEEDFQKALMAEARKRGLGVGS